MIRTKLLKLSLIGLFSAMAGFYCFHGKSARAFTTGPPAARTGAPGELIWRAPAESVGTVTFYAAGNAANGNGTDTGDFIYTTSASIQPASSSLPTVTPVSAASFAQGALASEAIAALYGTGLAAATAVASSIPLPTDLGGVKVRVKDASNTERNAQLFFVSGEQINFLVPSGTSNGSATLTVLRDDTAVGAGTIIIEGVSPGFFAANADGQGVPAAVVLRVQSNGAQTFEPVSQLNLTTNRFEPVAIDLGAETDQVFLIAYGTGFRNRSSLSAITCAIGGTNVDVLFAGAQSDLAGLDQANLRIPRSLAGRGDTDLVMTVDGKTTNTMQIRIK